MPSTPEPSAASPIVYFDGVCGLCNGFVDFLLRADRRRNLRFAPLQGETARTQLSPPLRDGLGTVVLVDSAGAHERSEAALRILAHVGPLYRGIAALARAVPRGWRDAVYDAIAQRRYRWFGKRESCRIPMAAERERFLP